MHNQINLDCLITAGDFNYSCFRTERLHYAVSLDWRALLDECFHNSMAMNDLAIISTF